MATTTIAASVKQRLTIKGILKTKKSIYRDLVTTTITIEKLYEKLTESIGHLSTKT
jgi:hypothetical protein